MQRAPGEGAPGRGWGHPRLCPSIAGLGAAAPSVVCAWVWGRCFDGDGMGAVWTFQVLGTAATMLTFSKNTSTVIPAEFRGETGTMWDGRRTGRTPERISGVGMALTGSAGAKRTFAGAVPCAGVVLAGPWSGIWGSFQEWGLQGPGCAIGAWQWFWRQTANSPAQVRPLIPDPCLYQLTK